MYLTGYDYFAVIYFEATCEENKPSYSHQITEFTAFLFQFAKFQEYVRPLLSPKLPSLCTSLTGIHTGMTSAEKVDQADPFVDVLAKVERWFSQHGLGQEKTFAVLTDRKCYWSYNAITPCKQSKRGDISRMAIKMLSDGCCPSINEQIQIKVDPGWFEATLSTYETVQAGLKLPCPHMR
ncbi:3'-5' exoribonuclease 1-like [Dreissena polymorpha]|uniref:3'-5' exoribonuclease 1-like n=1 Tax=Dreissena polymorpha TaxID=45954 RepID=UPI00226532EB|nr:3'-5' exoribonuclease 1-like [Dreissena polymorpha]